MIFYVMTAFFTTLFHANLFCMQQETATLPTDLIPTISLHLDLCAMSRLLSTCHAYAHLKGLPQYILNKADQVTKEDLLKIQFGVNRFLHNNPIFCKQCTAEEHTKMLMH